MRVLVTGGAGFIGSHLSTILNSRGYEVLAVDSFLDNYSVDLKMARVHELLVPMGVTFLKCDLSDRGAAEEVFSGFSPDSVVHLAARPGVREGLHTLNNYLLNNVVAFGNVLDMSVQHECKCLLYASSSSVYGESLPQPLSEEAVGLSPKSFYGATKLADELIAQSCVAQTSLSMIGLRLFTVYGPWGRPDMLPWRALVSALERREMPLYGDGTMRRDFTYIDDAVESILRLLNGSHGFSAPSHRLVNVGGGNQRSVIDMLNTVEAVSNSTVPLLKRDPLDADVKSTLADSRRLIELTGFRPSIQIEQGIAATYQWMSEPSIKSRLAVWSGLF